MLLMESIKHKLVIGKQKFGMSGASEDIVAGFQIKYNKQQELLEKEKLTNTKKALIKKNKKDAYIKNELIKNFMDTLGAKEINNKDMMGYTLNNIKVCDYGCSADIYAPYGMVLTELEKYSPLIETGCKCQFIYSIPEHRKFAEAKFIYPDQVKINDWIFKPIKVKPWEFCPGYDITGEPIIFDLNKMPQILVAGQQRRGKNGATDHALVSWINSCDESEITFYMLQCAKNDLIKYRFCKQVYCYATSFNEILVALDHIFKEYVRRSKLFEPMLAKGDGKDNIFHYNNDHPNNKLPYIIIVIDEFIELMTDSTVDDPDMKKLKSKILKRIQQIGQFGGSMGINYLILHQKPSAALMPVFIKNQSSVRLCFGFDDLTCCAIVLGDELAKHAHKLPPRKAFYASSDSNGFLYTPNITGQIRPNIEASIKNTHRDLFSDLEKVNAVPITIEIPSTTTKETLIPNLVQVEIETVKDVIKPIQPLVQPTLDALDDIMESVKVITPIPSSFGTTTPSRQSVVDDDKDIADISNYIPYNSKDKSL